MITKYNNTGLFNTFFESRLCFKESNVHNFQCPEITEFEFIGHTLYLSFCEEISEDCREKLDDTFDNSIKYKNCNSRIIINPSPGSDVEHVTHFKRNVIKIIIKNTRDDMRYYNFYGKKSGDND